MSHHQITSGERYMISVVHLQGCSLAGRNGGASTWKYTRCDRVFFPVPAQAYVSQFLGTFKEFQPRQKPASSSIDQVLQMLQTSGGSP